MGIAKYAVNNGVQSLSEKQLYVLRIQGILPNNYVEECERCAFDTPWSEMFEATFIYEDNLCSYCHHLFEKED